MLFKHRYFKVKLLVNTFFTSPLGTAHWIAHHNKIEASYVSKINPFRFVNHISPRILTIRDKTEIRNMYITTKIPHKSRMYVIARILRRFKASFRATSTCVTRVRAEWIFLLMFDFYPHIGRYIG